MSEIPTAEQVNEKVDRGWAMLHSSDLEELRDSHESLRTSAEVLWRRNTMLQTQIVHFRCSECGEPNGECGHIDDEAAMSILKIDAARKAEEGR